MHDYMADNARYSSMQYRRCGKSGLTLPAISLGLWHNFGDVDRLDNMRAMLRRAFDLGITHFDIANNYGPPAGSAETNFGRIMAEDLRPYRDELIISSKAGYGMWDGPYGDHGSKKYLVASIDQSLKRTGLEYFDIFYHHRPDHETPLEETMDALAHIVRSGKALYVGVSNYQPEEAKQASDILRSMGIKLTIHQPSYSMINRWVENGLQDVLDAEGIGSIAFCPLAQGVLTNKYQSGIPSDSRAARNAFLKAESITEKTVSIVRKLDAIALQRGQSLAQMSLAWVLRGGRLTSALIGASRVSQIEENVAALKNLAFSDDELRAIDDIVK